MFIDNKYTKIYYNIIDKAVNENRNKGQGVYYEGHHIVPECLGGKEKVLLTAKEHFLCHWLLCKMVDDPQHKMKMYHAFHKMTQTSGKQQRNFSSKLFEVAKKYKSIATKEQMKNIKRNPEWIKKQADAQRGQISPLKGKAQSPELIAKRMLGRKKHHAVYGSPLKGRKQDPILVERRRQSLLKTIERKKKG